MVHTRARGSSRIQKWGWGILIVVSTLLALNGAALFFISASPATFEQNTGVPMAEVSQAFPTVANQVVLEGQATAMILAGLGLMALVIGLEGFWHSSRWAWYTLWVLAGTLAVMAITFTFIASRIDISGFYLGLTIAALVGQLLAWNGLAARPGQGA